ncbi:putative pyroglutamyl peptidase type I [Aspergillus brunneoviolaceus CBS 621.78]|uniref:Peptidase C15, pyroglutamyl peptidase I-like protein n=1 Tax=Aspergillus brunneoviolaceus CBS 621.78 TaxID=1450534 RepID=A0ACD1G8W0_9EURO|nr:peptidase C15, pyroglutamyl peptidase I-like protein [Aspergillus brunneoviolaceus CBS 621.78]RAH45673.1 peptidase C15, pyroglutamyl peptidase I-like protein [Aspergillus brunneoviolaceus CBS 621.78]
MGDYGQEATSLETRTLTTHPSTATEPDEISVLVTGFGPFKTNLVNASYLIASSLPPSFTFSTTTPDSAPCRVSIHVHPSPIPVAYSTVRTTLPVILEEYAKAHDGRRPDIIIHMGIAATRNYYSVETQAHRDAYLMSDIKSRSGYEDGERIWRELDLPTVLTAGRASASVPSAKKYLNAHPPDTDFLMAWQSFAGPGTDVRISNDAGRYLCEFIFYSSLSLAYQEGQDRNVVFFHVPGSCTDEHIAAGKDAAIALIKALVTSWVVSGSSPA